MKVPITVGVLDIHNLKGEVAGKERPMNEITEWTMPSPVVLPKKGRHTISNEPSSALVAYVLSSLIKIKYIYILPSLIIIIIILIKIKIYLYSPIFDYYYYYCACQK